MAEATTLSVTNAVQLQRCLGTYPPGSLTLIYKNQASRTSFIYDARRGLVAAHDFEFQDQLGYLEGYAYNFCPGMKKGIVKLGHGVFLDQSGALGNMLQHIGSTMNRSLVNVHCDDNGLVVCTKPITASDTLLFLGVAPLPEQLPTESKHWLILNMVQAYKENQYFLVPSALIDASITSVPMSVAFGGSMTFMPLTLVLTYDLLVQYKNLSTENVASIQIAGQSLLIPCHESVFFPAFVPSSVNNIKESNVALFIRSPLNMNADELSIVTNGVRVVIHEDTDDASCSQKSNFRHLAQKLPTFDDNHDSGTPLPARLYRPDLPFLLSTPPQPWSGLVEPRKSLVLAAGTGLFAKAHIKKGVEVTWYGGALLHRTEWNDYKTLYPALSHFGLSLMNGFGSAYYTIDGFLNYGASLGRFANEPDFPNTANVTASWVQTRTGKLGSAESGYIAFIATRDILADSEIYYKYGIGYVRNW
jgi:hypothetical protein